jgi:hypothetical protein
VPVVEVVELRARLAFDHVVILREALERARAQLEYTTVATAFCPEPFSVADLRHVYEAVWGLSLDPSNFRRKVTRAEGFVVATGESRSLEIGRPAMLYRRGASRVLFPPLLRSTDFHLRDPDGSSDNEQVQVAADGGERLVADPAQVAAGSQIGDGADLLRHGV